MSPYREPDKENERDMAITVARAFELVKVGNLDSFQCWDGRLVGVNGLGFRVARLELHQIDCRYEKERDYWEKEHERKMAEMVRLGVLKKPVPFEDPVGQVHPADAMWLYHQLLEAEENKIYKIETGTVSLYLEQHHTTVVLRGSREEVSVEGLVLKAQDTIATKEKKRRERLRQEAIDKGWISTKPWWKRVLECVL